MIKIAVLTNTGKDNGLKITKKTISVLKNYPCELIFDVKLKDKLGFGAFFEYESVFKNADIIISLGGDGTMLHHAVTASKHGIPVLGINLGRMGYLTELEDDELEKLSKIFDNDYNIENRMMLRAQVFRKGEKTAEYDALNDIVITKGNILHTVSLDLFFEGTRVAKYKADGVIFSTPTGTTAYNLSAGGPIVDPKVTSITVTPICAHSLAFKPIVFSDTANLEIIVPPQKEVDVKLCADGTGQFDLKIGDKIKIFMSDNQTKLIKLNKYSFYETLNKKFSY